MSDKASFLLLLITFFCIIPMSLALQVDAWYGERCSDRNGSKCDESKFLICRDKICTCQNPETMIFDPLKGSCVTALGKVCLQKVPHPTTVVFNWQETKPLMIEKQTPCGTNAMCDSTSRVCVCQNPADSGVNGKCSLPKVSESQNGKVIYGGNCTTNSNCNASLHLVCVNKTCICDEDLAVPLKTYSWRDLEWEYKCVGKANKPCIDYECTENAACIKEAHPTQKGEYSLMCRCLSSNYFGANSSETGKCNQYGSSCYYKDKMCPTGLHCIDGSCQCKFPHHQLYEDGICWSLVGGPCNLTFIILPSGKVVHHNCINSAECEGNRDRRRCVCPENTVENSEGKCSLGFGHRCKTISHVSSESDIITDENLATCDKRGLLKCIEGTCQCPDTLYIYDEKEKRCRGLVGAYCKIEKNVNETEESPQFLCVSDAYCAPKVGSLGEGYCKCKDEVVETAEGTCEKSTAHIIVILIITVLLVSLFLFLGAYFIVKYCTNDSVEQFRRRSLSVGEDTRLVSNAIRSPMNRLRSSHNWRHHRF